MAYSEVGNYFLIKFFCLTKMITRGKHRTKSPIEVTDSIYAQHRDEMKPALYGAIEL